MSHSWKVLILMGARGRLLWTLLLAATLAPTVAQGSDHTAVFLGVDLGFGSGCTLGLEAFDAAGSFGFVVSVAIEDSETTAAEISCGSSQIPLGAGTPLALNLGWQGSDSFEIEIPASLLHGVSPIRIAAGAVGPDGRLDFLFTSNGTPASTSISVTSPLAVPSLSRPALVVMVFFLAFGAWLFLRNQRIAGACTLAILLAAGAWQTRATGPPSADGSLSEWSAFAPIATDPSEDTFSPADGNFLPGKGYSDLSAIYVQSDEEGLLLRIDFYDLETDACDGVDCSHLDTQCNVGRCDLASGACLIEARPDGFLCNDGSSCTLNDQCTGGECSGTGSCDGVCSLGEGVAHGDCDSVCDADDRTEGADCDGACDGASESEGLDCNNVCEPPDNPEGPDCNGSEDTDEDSIPDRVDRCPQDSGGAGVSLGEGCTSLGLPTAAERLVQPSLDLLASARKYLSALIDVEAARALEAEAAATDTRLRQVIAHWQGLAPCSARSELVTALTSLDNVLETEASTWTRQRASIELADESSDGHFGDGQIRTPLVDLGIERLEEARSEIDSLANLALAACAAIVETDAPLSGYVGSIDASKRLLWIDTSEGPIPVALPGDVLDVGIAEGFGVTASGKKHSDGSMLADSVVSHSEFDSSPYTTECIGLRIAPVQAFPPFSSQPLTLHHPAGYQLGGNLGEMLLLEKGSRIAAYEGGCPGTTPVQGQTYYRYRLQVGPVHDAVFNELKKVWIPQLKAGDTPVPIESAIGNASIEQLSFTVKAQRQTCLHPPPSINDPIAPCTNGETLWSKNYTVWLVERGSLCTSQYDRTIFEIEDDDYHGWQPAQISAPIRSDLFTQPQYDHTPIATTYHANACKIENGLHSCQNSHTAVVPVIQGDSFAVWSSDPVNAWNPLLEHGVSDGSPVTWPRIAGDRGGASFWYSCTVPEVIRDRITACPLEDADSYFRYPFYPGSSAGWSLGKGNKPSLHPDPPPGHTGHQEFAFDLGNSEGVGIRAGRGGRVVIAKSSAADSKNQVDCYKDLGACAQARLETCTDPPYSTPALMTSCLNFFDCETKYPCDNGNHVFIKHQDGSYGVYFHLQQTGFAVKKNQHVHRGDIIGLNGNTGFSYGPHVHFHSQISDVVDGWVNGVGSIPVRFETSEDECFLPWPGDDLDSNNGP